MKRVVFITLILFFAAFIRLYRLDTVPPLFHPSSFLPRLVTAIMGLTNVYLTYKLSVHYNGRVKIGLLSAFVMAVLPWTLEESRVYSSVNNGLGVILTGTYIGTKFRTKWQSFFITVTTLSVFLFVYKDIWILKKFQLIPIISFRDNLFRLLSPQLWFFNNITFYHGGLREWGMIYISLSPFLIYGMCKSITLKSRTGYILLGALIIFAALSPFFPESREFFLVVPFLSFLIGNGLYGLFFSIKSKKGIFLFILIALFLYEISQLLHYYYIHYPINVRDSADKIYEPF